MQTVLRVGNMTAREWLLCLLDQPVCNALKTNLGSDRRETVPELKTIGGTSLEGALRNHVAQLCFKKGQIYLRLFLIYVSHLFSICSEEYFNILNGRIRLLSISPRLLWFQSVLLLLVESSQCAELLLFTFA